MGHTPGSKTDASLNLGLSLYSVTHGLEMGLFDYRDI